MCSASVYDCQWVRSWFLLLVVHWSSLESTYDYDGSVSSNRFFLAQNCYLPSSSSSSGIWSSAILKVCARTYPTSSTDGASIVVPCTEICRRERETVRFSVWRTAHANVSSRQTYESLKWILEYVGDSLGEGVGSSGWVVCCHFIVSNEFFSSMWDWEMEVF